jgi:hypothetical protein
MRGSKFCIFLHLLHPPVWWVVREREIQPRIVIADPIGNPGESAFILES